MDNSALFNLSYGLFVITAKNGIKHNGFISNTVMQISSNPVTLAVSINKQNYTESMISETGEFNISVLSEKADFEIFKHFGFVSGKDVDKFDGYKNVKSASNGIYYITENTNSYFTCKCIQTIDCNTHTLFIAEVTDAEVISEDQSMTYGYYHQNVKPKPEVSEKKAWVCKICGYRYEGKSLPDDFICPLCKHPASDFEEV